MDNQPQALRELALFAGAGGGILGGKLLGWQTVCAVEYNAYARSVLLARQNDGTLAPFPIWDDVRTFDGKPWRGIVDVVSGGFPCQDISSAGTGGGALRVSEADYGLSKEESFSRWNQDSSMWKTAQCSLLEDSDKFSETWPRWGLMLNGECYQRVNSVQYMSVSASGSLLPTPTAHNSKEGAYSAEYNRKTPTLATHVGGKIHPNFTEWMMAWPMDWTALKPLETDKFQSWLLHHGKC